LILTTHHAIETYTVKTPGTPCTRGWVALRAGLDSEATGKILCLYRGSNPGRPVSSQTLIELVQTNVIRSSVLVLLFFSEFM